MTTLYGLKNCDSCRKAIAFLKAGGWPYRFHDLRDDGLPADVLTDWIDQVGWEPLLNRRSTTWRGLPEAEKKDLDAEKAVRLMLAAPTLVKRPVIRLAERTVVGFGAPQQAEVEAALGAAE